MGVAEGVDAEDLAVGGVVLEIGIISLRAGFYFSALGLEDVGVLVVDGFDGVALGVGAEDAATEAVVDNGGCVAARVAGEDGEAAAVEPWF